jgi:hypothetical protein
MVVRFRYYISPSSSRESTVRVCINVIVDLILELIQIENPDACIT